MLGLPSPAHAQEEPDFANTTDILNGETHMLRTDDLAAVNTLLPGSPPFTLDTTTLFMLTANSAVSATQQVISSTTATGPVSTPASIALGRMFDLPNDVAVVVSVDGGPPSGQGLVLAATVYDRLGNRSFRQVIVTNAPLSDPQDTLQTVMADFTGDGYDDLAVGYGASLSYVQIVQAVDPTNWAAGLKIGPASPWGQPFGDLAAADVEGSRVPLLAALANGLAANGAAASILLFDIDPQTLFAELLSVTGVPNAGQINAIVSGNYDGNAADDEVVVVGGQVGGTQNVVVQVYDFAGSPPIPVPLEQATVPVPILTSLSASSARVHPFSADSDAVALAVQSIDGSGLLTTFKVENGELVQQPFWSYENFDVDGVTLGRFDHRTAAGAIDPNLQLAVFGANDTTPSEQQLRIFDLGSSGEGYTLTLRSTADFSLPPNLPTTLAAGDLQGRSLRLGPPNKITIDGHSAPSTIVGMPPMHIDWVVPSCSDPQHTNCTQPGVVTILTKPASNYAQLNTSVKNSNQSSSQKTTSFSLATKETVGTKLSYGVPFVGSVSVDVKDSAQQLHDHSVATAQNAYGTFEFDASVRTGFADHVWFDNYRFNIWTYPVLGVKVCPEAKPSCSPSEQVPLHVQFSGPDQIASYDLDGSVLEWYQPVWEPGNLLSYPWREEQLLSQVPRAIVNNKSDVWAADSSGSNASVTWAQGGGQTLSQGSTNTFSNDAGVTVSAKASIAGFGISGSVGFDVANSKATQTLNTATNSRGSSTGFSVNKPAEGVADYVFAAQTYILGQAPLTGTVQSLPLTATVAISGPLRLSFWANPLDPVTGGEWWPTAYALPDVALNHPTRWTWTKTFEKPNIMTFNPVVTTTSPYDQEFYLMRGLLVTADGQPQGPQLTTAPVTETLLLQAVVYNYSAVDMDAATLAQPAAAVKVRFYGQLFRADEGEYPIGESFLIGEDTLAPLPGFASTTTPGDPPNRAVALETFSPADFEQTREGDVYVRFWVAVWMEDENGALVQEMEAHGLTADPGDLTITTMGDVPVQPYSNNVGTFKQVFYVQPAGGSGAQAASGALGASAAPTLTLAVEQTQPPQAPLPTMAGPLGKYLVTATLDGGSEPLSAVQLFYSEGPLSGPSDTFDWEHVPYVGAGKRFVNAVIYTPPACGVRKLNVVTLVGTQEIMNSTTVVNVPCVAILPFIGNGAAQARAQ
jgi:hypothetical protein